MDASCKRGKSKFINNFLSISGSWIKWYKSIKPEKKRSFGISSYQSETMLIEKLLWLSSSKYEVSFNQNAKLLVSYVTF